MTDRDFKIEMINAYRKLLEVTIKPVTKEKAVQEEVQLRFKTHVEEELNKLMGSEEESDDKLSSDEVSFLKQFISSAQARAAQSQKSNPAPLNKNEGTTNVRKPSEKKQDDSPAYVPRNPMPALGNRKMENKPSPNQSILDQLDEMDKKFENEF